MAVTIEQYWMGRDKTYSELLTDEVRHNVEMLLSRVNRLLALAVRGGVKLRVHELTSSHVSSGWRPGPVNAGVPGAAKKSRHQVGLAIDIYDPTGELDRWVFKNQTNLFDCKLWLEHPDATPNWCHLQAAPPKSGRLVFMP